MTVVAGIGHYIAWDGGCALMGRSVGVVPVHAHYAIQIAFGPERGIRFRPSERAEWTEYGGAIIPSRQPHSMDSTRLPFSAVMFVEPETREGRALTELYLQGGIAAAPDEVLADVAPALFTAWREERSTGAVRGAAWRVIQALTKGVEPSVAADERILRAVAYINAHLDAPLTLEEVAREAYLSPSRFRHLFVAETGMGLRPYVLWRRFLRAWDLVTAGESLSSAAHRAGFADSAHLTRTSRRMFGLAPSALQFAEPLRSERGAGAPGPVSREGAATPGDTSAPTFNRQAALRR